MGVNRGCSFTVHFRTYVFKFLYKGKGSSSPGTGILYKLDDFEAEYLQTDWHRVHDWLGDGREVKFPLWMMSSIKWSAPTYVTTEDGTITPKNKHYLLFCSKHNVEVIGSPFNLHFGVANKLPQCSPHRFKAGLEELIFLWPFTDANVWLPSVHVQKNLSICRNFLHCWLCTYLPQREHSRKGQEMKRSETPYWLMQQWQHHHQRIWLWLVQVVDPPLWAAVCIFSNAY